MNRFALGGSGQESNEPVATKENTVVLHGTFMCQFCDEAVTEARYMPEAAQLGWRCPNGHISVIKEFYV